MKTVWDRDQYNALKAAYAKAADRGERTFEFKIGGLTADMTLEYASTLIRSLQEPFSVPDQPRMPYNEGVEGQ